jgi:mycothiol synthase
MLDQPLPIKPLDLRTASAEEYRLLNHFDNRLLAERLPEDPPIPVEQTAQDWQNYPAYIDLFHWVAQPAEGETLAAKAVAYVRHTNDNQHLLSFTIEVLPEFRCQGLGRRLLAQVVDVAQRENRRLLLAWSNDRVPAGAAFLERLGATRGSEGHTNQLVLAELDRGLLHRWQTQAAERAAGFELVFWRGAFPEEHIEAAAALISAGASQQPHDQLEMEDFHYTADQLREVVGGALAAGADHWAMVARERATGQWVGLTDVFWQCRRPQIINIGMTVVLPDYRQRGLGRWLKAALLERILNECPAARYMRTNNADSNAAMLKINHELGFKPFIAQCIWQVSTDQAAQYLHHQAGAHRSELVLA